jgi:hypothetical protein
VIINLLVFSQGSNEGIKEGFKMARRVTSKDVSKVGAVLRADAAIRNHEGQVIREGDELISTYRMLRGNPPVIGIVVGFRYGTGIGTEAVIRMTEDNLDFSPRDNIMIYAMTELNLWAEAGHGSTVSVNTKTKWFVA